MDGLVCDFCSGSTPGWCYPAASFVAMNVGAVASASEGDWAACDECQRLIEHGDRAGLAERSASRLIASHPEFEPIQVALRQELQGLHDLFFAHRLGPCLRIQMPTSASAQMGD
jgi:hypothetical protein